MADWTDRIARGELPSKPRRPQGVERNVVISQWDWADPKAYLHDGVEPIEETQRQMPTVMYTAPPELSTDYLPVLDPNDQVRSARCLFLFLIQVRNLLGRCCTTLRHIGATPLYGTAKPMFTTRCLDKEGRVDPQPALPSDNPDFCKVGSNHPSAKAFPVDKSSRHLGVYDPKTRKYTPINTCFSTHHLMFAEDENNTLWTSGGGT